MIGLSDTPLSEDLLEGTPAISVYTGIKQRRLFYLAGRGELPLFKIGNKWCARRSTLRAYFEKLESGETA